MNFEEAFAKLYATTLCVVDGFEGFDDRVGAVVMMEKEDYERIAQVHDEMRKIMGLNE